MEKVAGRGLELMSDGTTADVGESILRECLLNARPSAHTAVASDVVLPQLLRFLRAHGAPGSGSQTKGLFAALNSALCLLCTFPEASAKEAGKLLDVLLPLLAIDDRSCRRVAVDCTSALSAALAAGELGRLVRSLAERVRSAATGPALLQADAMDRGRTVVLALAATLCVSGRATPPPRM